MERQRRERALFCLVHRFFGVLGFFFQYGLLPKMSGKGMVCNHCWHQVRCAKMKKSLSWLPSVGC